MAQPNYAHTRWIKSSFSEPATQCVELAVADGQVGVRDSKLGDASPVLSFTPGEFRAFLSGAKAGEFDELV